MPKIQFTREERAEMVLQIQRFFDTELDVEIGAIPAERVLEFFGERLGGFFYNRGLNDAQAVFTAKLDDINDTIYGLEQRDARTR